MKTIELTEEEIQKKTELRYKVWEAKIEKNRNLTGTLGGIGW